MAAICLRQGIKLSKAEGVVLDREAGIMRNVSVLTRGPAIGHGFIVDDIMLDQVQKGISAKGGVKSRLTHPDLGGLCGGGTDGIELMVGRLRDARLDEDRVRGDLHFGKYAESSPKGDLKRYLFDLAEEEAEGFGLSIVFDPDEFEASEQTGESLARVKEVFAVDFVGDPGANPGGLLSQGKAKGASPMEDLKPNDGETLEQFLARFTGDAGMKEKHGDQAEVKAREIYESLHGDEAGDHVPCAEATTCGMSAEMIAQALKRQTVDEALSADAKRRKDIMDLGKKEGAPLEWTLERANAPEMTVEKFNQLLEVAGKMKPIVTVGGDRNLDTLGPAVEDAISLKAGIRVEKAHPRAADFRRLRLSEIARRYLEALGVPGAAGMSMTEVSKLVFSKAALSRAMGGIALAHSTSDFPFILANVLGKSLRSSYELAQATWPIWCSRATAPDFKQQSAVILSSAPALAALPEGTEYTFGTMTEGREVYTIVKYGKGLKFTREMLINDDLGAFNRIVPQMGAKAKYLEDVVAYGILTANAALGNDSIALFEAGTHVNTGTGAISVANLAAGYTKMGVQKDLDGAALIENTPVGLIVPKALEIVAKQLVNSTFDPAATTSINTQVPNPFAGSLKIAASPILDATSAAVWYLFADPAKVDTVVVVFLEGEEQPVLDEEEDFDTDCRKYKVRHQVVAKALDYRGLFRSSGV